MSPQSYPQLELYYFDSCPYCQRVLKVIRELNLKVTYCDTLQNREHGKKLLKDTGRSTVPCLYIDGRPMHESLEINKWLRENEPLLEKKHGNS